MTKKTGGVQLNCPVCGHVEYDYICHKCKARGYLYGTTASAAFVECDKCGGWFTANCNSCREGLMVVRNEDGTMIL